MLAQRKRYRDETGRMNPRPAHSGHGPKGRGSEDGPTSAQAFFVMGHGNMGKAALPDYMAEST